MFAKRLEKIQAEELSSFFERAGKMKNPINLSIGQTSFDVHPKVKGIVKEAIDNGFNGYTLPGGLPELIQEIAVHLEKNGIDLRDREIIITNGGSGGLLLALYTFVDPGDEVLMPDPYFATYPHLARLVGGIPRFIDTYPHFKLTPELLRKAITDKTRVLLFNHPVNPTGIAYDENELKAIAEEAEKLNIQVISDEVYDHFSYDFSHHSFINYSKNAVLVNAFSKTYGMAGWRIGYSVAKKEAVEKMKMIQQFTFVCENPAIQKGCVQALKMNESDGIKDYKEKRDFLYNALKGSYQLVFPQGAFYLFAEIPYEHFLDDCLSEELLVLPGRAFSQKKSHFRISFSTDIETLKKGIHILLKLKKGQYENNN